MCCWCDPQHTGVTVSDQKRKHSSRGGGGALLSSDIYLTLELTEAWGKKTNAMTRAQVATKAG